MVGDGNWTRGVGNININAGRRWPAVEEEGGFVEEPWRIGSDKKIEPEPIEPAKTSDTVYVVRKEDVGGGGDGRNRGGGYGKGNGGDGGGGDGGTAVGWGRGRKEDGGLGYGTKGKRKDLVIHIHKAMGASKTTKQSSGKGFKLSFPILCRGVDVAIPLPSSAASSSPSTSTSPSLRSKARVQELREVFRHFDGDHDGKISVDELRSFFTSIGEGMSPEEAEGVIADLNSDGHGLLDFGGFLALMERDGMDEDLRKVFEMFEAMNGSGRITPWGLQRMLNRLGDERSYEECEAMIQACDLDGNGEGPVGKRREEAAGWKNPWTGNNGGRQLWRDL